jgi:hypothetical protein
MVFPRESDSVVLGQALGTLRALAAAEQAKVEAEARGAQIV